MQEPPRPTLLWLMTAPPGAGNAPKDEPRGPATRVEALEILIVEDEFFIALDIQAQVEALGHAVVGTAVSAEQAVEQAQRHKPDVVLMDIRLVGARDGVDAALEIKQRCGIEAIFVTANTDPATLQRARSVAPLGVLRKPLTRAALQDMLARVPHRPR